MIWIIGYPCLGNSFKLWSHLFLNEGSSGVTEDILKHICFNECSLWEKSSSYHAVHWIMYYLNTPRYQKKISNFKGDSFLHKFIHRAPTALEKSLKFSSVSRSCKTHWISWKVHFIKMKKSWTKSLNLGSVTRGKIIEFWHRCSIGQMHILGVGPANERRHYFVMMSLIGWVQA